MKKVIFALAAVVALAACSNEQTIIADKGTAIGFDTFVENSTRATDPSLTVETMKTDGFGVYGFVTNGSTTAPLFTNEHIKYNDNNGWHYDVKQYWIDGATYDFAAIAPYDAYTVTSANTDGVQLSFVSDGETDLLYAQNNGVTGPRTSDGKVGFTFKHVLSKVKFTFTNGYDATNTVIAVKNVHITNALAEGDAQLGRDTNGVTAAWTVDAANDANLDLAFDNATADNGYIAQNASEDTDKALLLIPTNNHTYVVTYTVELYYKVDDEYELFDTYTHTVNNFTPNFEYGKSYNVTTTITPTNIDPEAGDQTAIEFTVDAIDEWTEATTNM